MKRRRVRSLLKNPIIIIVPFVAMCLLGWRFYLMHVRAVTIPEGNLLPYASFDEFDADTIPKGWRINNGGDIEYASSQAKGYVGGTSYELAVKEYRSGNLDLESPKVIVQPGATYLYKGYYATTADFDLLVRCYYNDGTNRLKYTRHYPGDDHAWSTNGTAFRADKDVQAVQFVYRMISKGSLHLDDTYLTIKSDGIYVPPTSRDRANLIPNGEFERANSGAPEQWSSYSIGANQSSFAYKSDGENNYVQTSVASYRDGEAKWQYEPLAVKPHEYYAFGVSYQSNVTANIVVEYLLSDGSRKFDFISTLAPASAWTYYETNFEVPASASSMFVTVVLQTNGVISTDDYALYNNTRSGPPQFTRPLVSITFDDGWKSSYESGASIMDRHGLKGTFYINPTTLDTANFVTTREALDLMSRGHELASHGYTHVDMTSISAKQLKYQLQSTFKFMTNLTGVGHSNFATPYGKSDAEVEWFAREYYRTHRGTDDGINTRQNFNPFDLKVLYIDASTPHSTIERALKDSREKNGWLILVYHRIERKDLATKQSDILIPPSVFDGQMELLARSGVVVRTIESAMDELEPQL